MFRFEELSRIQIEITNRCQASCPMCSRNIHGGIDNPLVVPNDWTLDDFKNIFSLDVLMKIDTIDFCGDFGEPILNNDLLAMCGYARTINPTIAIVIYTNGSARSTDWWKQLAKVLPKDHRVVFALDGLSDTHNLYRIGTNYSAILKNAQAFITAGGHAHWCYIRFAHNDHQIAEARALSQQLGFEQFILKNSKRFGKSFPVLGIDGLVTHTIEQPQVSPIKVVDKTSVENYKTWPVTTAKDCFVHAGKEIYIDSHYTVLPCCILASFLYTNYEPALYKKFNVYQSMVDVGLEVQNQVYEILDELGGLDKLNALTYGIENIISTDAWQTIWQNKWAKHGSAACTIMCSQSSPYISIDEQTKL